MTDDGIRSSLSVLRLLPGLISIATKLETEHERQELSLFVPIIFVVLSCLYFLSPLTGTKEIQS